MPLAWCEPPGTDTTFTDLSTDPVASRVPALLSATLLVRRTIFPVDEAKAGVSVITPSTVGRSYNLSTALSEVCVWSWAAGENVRWLL